MTRWVMMRLVLPLPAGLGMVTLAASGLPTRLAVAAVLLGAGCVGAAAWRRVGGGAAVTVSVLALAGGVLLAPDSYGPAVVATVGVLAAGYVVCVDATGAPRAGLVLRHQWRLLVAALMTSGVVYVVLAAPAVHSAWVVAAGLVAAGGTYGLVTRGPHTAAGARSATPDTSEVPR